MHEVVPKQNAPDSPRQRASKEKPALRGDLEAGSFLTSKTSFLFRKANCACGGDCPRCEAESNNLKLQTKLQISTPGDAFELEADRVADQVMRMPDAVLKTKSKSADESPNSHNEEPLIKRAVNSRAGISEIASDFTSRLGSSVPLDEASRSYFEPRFGHDFGDVRIHDGPEAANAAASIQARAFTLGRDLVFAAGQHNPSSERGRRLLAHELTHVVQQSGVGRNPVGGKSALSPVSLLVENSSLQPMMIQRDFAVPPTAPDAVPAVLTAAQMRRALSWNQAVFSDADEISLLRNVLEISAAAVIDEDFVRGLVHYQAVFGLTQDGLLGGVTAQHLADELRARAGLAGATPDVATGTEMALNPAERRMRLRSRVVGRLGRTLHQGFIGPRDSPTGVVTVRSGFSNPAAGTHSNLIGLNYTGSNVANSRWLQFAFRQMSAIDPATGARVYRPGSVTTSGGIARPYSDGTTFRWTVDTAPGAGSMYYEAGFVAERTAAHTEILDQPGGWHGEADAFAGTFATRPNRVRMINGFDTYLVVNNNSVVYHVRWNVYFNFNTTITPTTDVTGSYEALTSGAARRLPAALKTVLDAQFPTNTVP